MSRYDRIGGGLEFIDVNGSVERFLVEGPKELRRRLAQVVLATCAKLNDRMAAAAPEGPDAPHIKETVTFKQRGLSGSVGYLAEDFGGEQAGEHNTATIAEVALYNEYAPNHQPFMKPSAEAESSDFVRRVTEAIATLEKYGMGGSPFPK